MNVNEAQTILLPPGQLLTVTVGNSFATGTLTRKSVNPGDAVVYSPLAIAGVNFSIGPFAQTRYYEIACTLETLTFAKSIFDAKATGIGSVPAAVTATVVATETGNGVLQRTRLTLSDMAQAVVNGTEYQGTEIYDFPEGRILVLGVVAMLAQKTTSVIASTLNASVTGSLGLGTATASSTTLATTMVDLGPATAFTTSATINVAGTAVSPVLAAAAPFDGTATAKKMFLNSAYATTGDVDADATQTWSGTIDITWINLGDK